MKNQILFSLIALMLIAFSTDMSAQKYGMFTEFLGPTQQLTEFFVPGGPNETDPYKVIIAFHPYNTPPQAIKQMVMPSAENYNAILVCPNVHPDYKGDITTFIMEYLNENYDIDNDNVVLTGYSAGGSAMLDYGLPNNDKVKGLIGIAPSINIPQSDYLYLDKLPISSIVGTQDHLYNSVLTLKEAVENRGGSFFLVEKQGVAHTGAYFYSMEFTEDWNSCYDFIQSWLPKTNPITLIAPENNTKNMDIQIDFSWEDNELADTYKIQISENLQFDPILEEETIADTEYKSKRLKNGRTYFWRVCGMNSSGDGLWSNTWTFSTITTAPSSPELVNPKDGAENVLFPVELHWNSVVSAEKYILRLWQVNEDELLLEEEIEESGMRSYTKEAPCEPGTEYRWQVEAVNISGSAISHDWFFTTLPKLNDTPELLYPEDNAENLPVDIEFRWKSLSKADSYIIQIFEYGSENPVFEKNDIKSSSQLVKTAVKLESGKSYVWHVCGVNNAGAGPWTEMNGFTTDGTNSFIDINNAIYLPYPNPFKNDVIISFDPQSSTWARLSITDNSGKEVYSDRMDVQLGINSFYWQPNKEQSGNYFYNISLSNGTYISGKLIYLK
jgi:hypothetical protein